MYNMENILEKIDLEINDKDYYLDKEGYYVINNFDKLNTFSSFLSAIVGERGIPLWSFYVNRGQGICSFGLRDKNNAMMEFYPANESYKQVYTNGFRTFLKIDKDNKVYNYEPFSSIDDEDYISRTMKIKNNELIVEDTNEVLGVKTIVKYYILPNEDFASMVRKVEVQNISQDEINIEVVDGMPAITPFGISTQGYKEIGNTLKSWMEGKVQNTGLSTYAVTSSTNDSARVEKITKSYFYISFDKDNSPLTQIVNPETIFGYDTSYIKPREFKKLSIEDMKIDDISYNKVPCAFTVLKDNLEANKSIEINSLVGYSTDREGIAKIQEKVSSREYIETKRIEANKLIEAITKDVNTKTAYPLFDEYVKQSYIDNILRGGYPIKLGDDKVYHIYSRKHGDLERDYNFFSIEDNFYSQGNGNFRDLNQNRRLDVFFKPFTQIESIKLFFDLIQLDGYNPLVIKGKKFKLDEKKFDNIKELFKTQSHEEVKKEFTKEVTIGEIYKIILECGNLDQYSKEETLNKIVSLMDEDYDIAHGEGFWVDHWTYNLDLVEEYLNIYPENMKQLLFENNIYRFYNSPEYVVKRDEKYLLVDGKVRQYNALKEKDLNKLTKWVENEHGEVVTANLFNKLLMLATLKFSSLDVNGYGIEMEGNKPGWNDSMNGLPGLLASSMAETLELKRLLTFIKDKVSKNDNYELIEEFSSLLLGTKELLEQNLSGKIANLYYWDKVTSLRENYRDLTRYTVNGKIINIDKEIILDLVEKMINKIDIGLEKLNKDFGSFIPTYFCYDVDKYEINNNVIKPVSFKLNPLPQFLEGAVRKFKTNLSDDESLRLYKAVKSSGTYDKKLGMYKTSACLENESLEIGRGRAFTKGWLERESVFMHMEFKYLLELIKNGLYEEFYEDIKTTLPPFMNPKVYGRSILENSSFIASSSNPDEKVHGRGFIARLSGTTVELLSIWKNMMVGKEIFTIENNELVFNLCPILSENFFDENNEVTFTMLGGVKVKYINPSRVNTYKEGRVKNIVIKYHNGEEIEFEGNKIYGQYAKDIRDLKVEYIEATIS